MENWLDLPELVDRVQELLDLGLYDEGHELLKQYESIYENQWEMHFLFSRIYSEQSKPGEAILFLKRGIELDENNVDCLLGLFYAHTQIDQTQTGAQYLLRAASHHPDNELVTNALIWYYTETSHFSKATSCYERSRSILSGNAEALRNVGIAYERLGHYDKARACFEESLALNPNFDEARDLLADHYIMSGEPARSVALYRNYLEQSPNNIRSLSRLVFCLSQNDQMAEAEKAARHTTTLYPNSPVGYVDLSYVLLNSGKADQAIEAADRALDVSPIDPEALRVKAIAYSEKESFDDAEKTFLRALSLDPDNPEILRDYYHHLRSADKLDKMEETVLKVIEQEHPYCMEDYWFLAEYYRETGRNLKAFHYLNKAYRSMPGERELIPPMVEIMLDMGHVSFAVPVLKRYIEANGWNNTMNRLTFHKGLRGKWSQEGLRFLRFYGQKPVDYRKFVFLVYLRQFGFVSFLLLPGGILTLSFIYSSTRALMIALAATVFIFVGRRALMYLRFRAAGVPRLDNQTQ